MWQTHRLVSLHSDAGGEKDTGGQGNMTDTFSSMVHIGWVELVVLQGYGAHGQAGDEEHHVCKAEEDQQVVEHGGHLLLAQHKDTQYVANNS